MNKIAAFFRTVLTPDGFIASAYGYAANQAGHGMVGVLTFSLLVHPFGPVWSLYAACAIWAAFEGYNRLRNGAALPWLTAASSAAYMGSGAVLAYADWQRDWRLLLASLALFCVSLAIGIGSREP